MNTESCSSSSDEMYREILRLRETVAGLKSEVLSLKVELKDCYDLMYEAAVLLQEA
ncbi:hypothetical protein [Salinicola halophilus]|uniref:hypothetical protein n=1 Tax=Salinicola halophilus TaxID=184065 RepID=UPI0013A61FEA|nr:hypothetical protein [Salinicola halophilus]